MSEVWEPTINEKCGGICPLRKSWMFEVVANFRKSCDVDRMDYLMRDSKWAGQVKGFNFKRYFEYSLFRSVKDNQNETIWTIAVPAKDVHKLETEFFQFRKNMHWDVYQHKTVIAIEEHMLKILEKI